MIEFKEIRKLYDIWDDSFGLSEQEIIECEERLGKRLPKVLRDYYQQFGNNKTINQTQDRIILPKNFYIEKNRFVSFYSENQGNWQAFIKLSDFDLDDPTVYFDGDESEPAGSVSKFLYGMALLQSIFAFPFTAQTGEIDLETESVINHNWKAVMFFRTPSFLLTFFQNSPDEIICLMKSGDFTDIAIAGKTKDIFISTKQKLNLIWDYNSLEDE